MSGAIILPAFLLMSMSALSLLILVPDISNILRRRNPAWHACGEIYLLRSADPAGPFPDVPLRVFQHYVARAILKQREDYTEHFPLQGRLVSLILIR